MQQAVTVPTERIAEKIYIVRGRKVMLDRDLAELYGVPTKVLKQAVRRNTERFPEDFMFQLSQEELGHWRSQFVTSKQDRKGLRWAPYAFTEQGIAMLSGVLNSPRAVAVNIQIIRTFTKLRELLAENGHLRLKIEAMERNYDKQFKIVFDAIRQLLAEPASPSEEIGFKQPE